MNWEFKPVTQKELTLLLNHFDKSKNGIINFNDFINELIIKNEYN